MIVLGIILLVIGALVAAFSAGDIERIGKFVAALGVVLIVIGLVLVLADSADDDIDADMVLLAPGLAWAALRGRLRTTTSD